MLDEIAMKEAFEYVHGNSVNMRKDKSAPNNVENLTAPNSAMDAIALQKALFVLFRKYMSSADSSILVKEVLAVVQQHQ